ncbi:Dihydropterin pyrophosphokinase / Dihydropteroate synthase-like protein [Theobroma cacao]|uniref:2-amino-4-hydroxy-6-hydroxymethyldihydropteridine diphosphokinase n=1 Tax=Theobroma cacao TaxID=3641 RepID=A0A061EAN3_THECC|nr:Dihydropterin pyrophosphokinase / Dihydropteroate synthase-like protein [Theobroma cacao]
MEAWELCPCRSLCLVSSKTSTLFPLSRKCREAVVSCWQVKYHMWTCSLYPLWVLDEWSYFRSNINGQIQLSHVSVALIHTSFCAFLHTNPDQSVEVHSRDQEVVIALGSNTAPAYVSDQPRFHNFAVSAVTKLGPHELLGVLMKIEKDMGRAGGIRYGPRPIDLDILFYYRIGSVIDSVTITCWHSFSTDSDGLFGSWEKFGGESLIGKEGMKRFYPLGIAYGIEGADIVDIGAQSTLPMASRISAEEELDRLNPVLEAVLGMSEMKGKLISVDTFYSDVASEAVASELFSRVNDAELSGIPAWRIILDPGIGFSKKTEH